MTPNEINVLLHYHVCIEEHPRVNARAIEKAIKFWISHGVFTEDGMGVIKVTEKGRTLVEMLCSTPLPVMSWKDPR